MMDAGAMLISGLCLVHCLALPLLLALLPLAAASFVADEHFHRWLLLAIVPVSALALVSGCRRHRSLRVLLCGAAAVTLLVFAAYGNAMVGLSPLGESILTIAGGLLLATAHFINLAPAPADASSNGPRGRIERAGVKGNSTEAAG